MPYSCTWPSYGLTPLVSKQSCNYRVAEKPNKCTSANRSAPPRGPTIVTTQARLCWGGVTCAQLFPQLFVEGRWPNIRCGNMMHTHTKLAQHVMALFPQVVNCWLVVGFSPLCLCLCATLKVSYVAAKLFSIDKGMIYLVSL